MRQFLNAIEAGSSLEAAADTAGSRLSTFYARADPETTTYDARFAAEFATVQAARARTLTWREAEGGEWRAIDKVGNTYVPEMQPRPQEVSVTGDVEVNHPDVAAAIERFTARVVSLATGRGAGEALELPVGEGEGRLGLPVASVDREAEPGGTTG